MTATQILDLIHQHGGAVNAEGGKLKLRAPAPLPPEVLDLAREHKPELLALLTSRADLEASCRRVEAMRIAIQIHSDEYGTLWLVSSEAERSLADAGDPTYTAAEARRMIGIPHELVRQIHQFKRAFGGSVDRIQEDQ